MKQTRYSRLQNIILEELGAFPDKVARPEDLSIRTANRYDPEKVWRLQDCRPEIKAFARRLHRKQELVQNIFSVSFSRALRSLERKRVIQLVKCKWESKMEDGKWVFYRLHTPQPRVTLVVHHESRYFNRGFPDIERFVDICADIFKTKYVDVPLDVNNSELIKKEN
jgi:hypothetical protein